jgi:hypothetical protein
VLWFLCCAWLIWTDFQTPLLVKILLAGSSLYLLSVSGIQQLIRAGSDERAS